MVWKARPSLAMWQALLIAGLTGFGCAIGVHFSMNYLIPLPPHPSLDRRRHLHHRNRLLLPFARKREPVGAGAFRPLK